MDEEHCVQCDRDRSKCDINSLKNARDLAWKEFNLSCTFGGFVPEDSAKKAVCYAATRAVTGAEKDCLKHAVDWRARALDAERVLDLWREYRFQCSDIPGAVERLDKLLLAAEDATAELFTKLEAVKS